MIYPYIQRQKAATLRVRQILDCSDAEDADFRGCDDFNPWNIFQSLYGTYSDDFDQCAIDVLCDIRDGQRRRVDLAAEMFREMLCTADLCDYGTSPRGCYPTIEFREILPELIERWKAFSRASWNLDQ